MRRMLTALLLCALLLPVAALAREQEPGVGEQWTFQLDAERKYIRLHTVVIYRQGGGASMQFHYTVPEEKLRENSGKVEDITFYRMPDAESTEMPTNEEDSWRTLQMEVVTGGDPEKIAGHSYIYFHEWRTEGAWPEVLYLRPYYRALEEWGEALELRLEDATDYERFTPKRVDPDGHS